MDEPLTEELLGELIEAPDLNAYLDENEPSSRSLSDYLQQLLEETGMRQADVVRVAGINETFGYQIFKGQRGASRDKVLQLAFALRLDLRRTNRLLQAAGANGLYCKNRRDAILIFAVEHGYDLQKTNEELYRFGEATLG
ncbi:MAG: helix-turn-helix domain-containing protein [Coriobacteriales bacterium]